MAGINHERVVAARDKGLAEDWNADHEQTGNHDADQNQFLNQVIENRTDFPAAPVEGQVIYRTDENILYIYDGTGWQPYVGIADSCFVCLTGNQSIPNNVFTAIDWDKELWDTNNMHESITNPDRITFNKRGLYQVNVHIKWAQNAVSYRGITTIVNNCTRGSATFSEGANSASYGYYQSMSFVIKAEAGGFFRLLVLQNSGAALNLMASELETNADVTYLGYI